VIISLIVAMDKKGGIGKGNKLPWHLSSDLKRFKRITYGHHIVMGRKTYQSMGAPLPGRNNIIISRQKDYSVEGCQVAGSLKDAISMANNENESELFIIGGGEIFTQAISLADKIYITTIHTICSSDVFFPQIDEAIWKVIHKEKVIQEEGDDFASDFQILTRID
jgi:dihydrofolate reductase